MPLPIKRRNREIPPWVLFCAGACLVYGADNAFCEDCFCA